MSEERERDLHQWVVGNVPIVIAILFSALVVMLIASLAHRKPDSVSAISTGSETSVSRWEWFFQLSPNEMGDTLAGILGALTLIWIIASVFHQSRELADQREVLREQREEFALMVAAQNAQVAALDAQARIFLDEKAYRDHERAEKKLNALIARIAGHCRTIQRFQVKLVPSDDAPAEIEYWSDRTCSFFHDQLNENDEALVKELTRQLLIVLVKIKKFSLVCDLDKQLKVKFKMRKEVEKLQGVVSQMFELKGRLSEDQEVRFEGLDLEHFQSSLNDLLSQPIWQQSEL